MKDRTIITRIKEDHMPLKECIGVLKSESANVSQKKSALKKFLHDLRLHAKAEEQALYENAVGKKDVRRSILEGYEEHSIADLLADELDAMDYMSNWSDEVAAKAKVIAELVEHHVDEEEREMLPGLKSALSLEELIILGEEYADVYRVLKNQISGGVIKDKTQEQVPVIH